MDELASESHNWRQVDRKSLNNVFSNDPMQLRATLLHAGCDAAQSHDSTQQLVPEMCSTRLEILGLHTGCVAHKRRMLVSSATMVVHQTQTSALLLYHSMSAQYITLAVRSGSPAALTSRMLSRTSRALVATALRVVRNAWSLTPRRSVLLSMVAARRAQLLHRAGPWTSDIKRLQSQRRCADLYDLCHDPA